MSISYDLIIVAKSSRDNLKRITQSCIDSARAEGDMNVILVETSGFEHQYRGVDQTLEYQGAFCYNRALNQGLEKAEGDVHILANNDIIFHPGWSVIGQSMIDAGFPSACVLSQDPRHRSYDRGDFIYPGYRVGYELVGWCIFVTKDCIKELEKLDESYDFWYSDNMYANQLIDHRIKHGLFCNARVDHVTSQTMRTLPPRDQRKFTFSARNKYASR